MNTILTHLKLFVRFWRIIFVDFYQKDSLSRACALTYTTLLAMVPLMFVFVSILSIFPAFQDIPNQIQHFVFDNFVPSTGNTVQTYIQSSLNRASSLPIFSLIFLLVTAMMMMLSIETNLNGTWDVKFTRRLSMSILLYWAVLTLGPLLLATSLLLSSYFSTLSWLFHRQFLHINLILLLPFLATFIGFWFIYIIVPHTKVKLYQAASGALVSAILFELAKHLFTFYVVYFPTYQKLYGVLATIPLFLFWVYCCWMIFLFGGLVVNTLRLDKVRHNDQKVPKLIIALTIMGHLFSAQQKKTDMTIKALLSKQPDFSTAQTQEVIDHLLKHNFISQSEGYTLQVKGDYHHISLYELTSHLHYFIPNQKALSKSQLPNKLQTLLIEFNKIKKHTLKISLTEVLCT